MDIQSIDFSEVLKWSLIVLITGFIAQFGKSLAKYFLARIRPGKTAEIPEQEAADRKVPQLPIVPPIRDSAESGKPETAMPVSLPDDKSRAKLRKKEIKAQVKQKKKEKSKE